MNLTPKQERFCLEYLKSSNASEAYRLAYDAQNMKSETINRKAFDLLQNGKITARLADLNAKVEKEYVVDAAELLREAARVTFSDIRNILHPDGRVRLPHELDEATARAVKSFKIDEYGRIEYQFWDKNAGMEKLFKNKGLYEQDNKQKTDPLADILMSLPGAVMSVAKVLNDDTSGD